MSLGFLHNHITFGSLPHSVVFELLPTFNNSEKYPQEKFTPEIPNPIVRIWRTFLGLPYHINRLDVSYLKPTKQSSAADGKHSADRAVDGDLTTYSQTKQDDVSWWEVDMGKAYEIYRIDCYLDTIAHSKGETNS